MNKPWNINADWTLFLDRDGVINVEKTDSYIFHFDEFVFYEEAREALRIFNELFGRIVVVTNQRGVGRGMMTADALKDIHDRMVGAIGLAGGRIDRIYYADSLRDDHPLRKPNPGMAHAARMDFPEIDFSKSVMVGNNISDMEFGKNSGMHTVFVRTTDPKQTLPHPFIDLAFNSLYDFAKSLLLK
jgi:D-glycero-D-manno-heptose 1,7-bisphosphate phosphatase